MTWSSLFCLCSSQKGMHWVLWAVVYFSNKKCTPQLPSPTAGGGPPRGSIALGLPGSLPWNCLLYLRSLCIMHRTPKLSCSNSHPAGSFPTVACPYVVVFLLGLLLLMLVTKLHRFYFKWSAPAHPFPWDLFLLCPFLECEGLPHYLIAKTLVMFYPC